MCHGFASGRHGDRFCQDVTTYNSGHSLDFGLESWSDQPSTRSSPNALCFPSQTKFISSSSEQDLILSSAALNPKSTDMAQVCWWHRSGSGIKSDVPLMSRSRWCQSDLRLLENVSDIYFGHQEQKHLWSSPIDTSRLGASAVSLFVSYFRPPSFWLPVQLACQAAAAAPAVAAEREVILTKLLSEECKLKKTTNSALIKSGLKINRHLSNKWLKKEKF